MAATITNIRSTNGMGIFSDRDTRSEPLQFRKYNLVYGFNGSGKSTLSRLFASLETGAKVPELPEKCSFDVELSDGTNFGYPAKISGLERRILVFNCDYVERNLQWSTGRARPVFYIGAAQADAAKRLDETIKETSHQIEVRTSAVADQKAAEKDFATFKRERAKLVASRLHLGNRKYEAPALLKDYESWRNGKAQLLSEHDLNAAEDTRRLDEIPPRVKKINFDTNVITKAYSFIIGICTKSLTTVALSEVERFPEILLWLKHGREFHEKNHLENCLFCGNAISTDRLAVLEIALNDSVDQFIHQIKKTSERLNSLFSSLQDIINTFPNADYLTPDLSSEFHIKRDAIFNYIGTVKNQLSLLQDVLSSKLERPASPADLSHLSSEADVILVTSHLATAISGINLIIDTHNNMVDNFSKRKEEAGLAIRKHFIADCEKIFTQHIDEINKFKDAYRIAQNNIDQKTEETRQLQQKIREHGPAADTINKLVSSYLGHSEISIEPVDQGYVLLRYGRPIRGIPSEGEKTAIAIAYFLSSVQAEGRKLKDLIVVVDDPVSSLDTKALNYACTLVRSQLEGASQLFILTHNLQALNEFRKSWKSKARPSKGKEPTAAFKFIDVAIPEGETRRYSRITEMSRLLREYDSEYHFLFSHIFMFTDNPSVYYDYSYMLPNVLRRVLDVFLAFKCPGMGLSEQIKKLCIDYSDLDPIKMIALERLVQVESHSDNLDDLLSFSSMTLEESRSAANALIEMMQIVDQHHLNGVRRICRP